MNILKLLTQFGLSLILLPFKNSKTITHIKILLPTFFFFKYYKPFINVNKFYVTLIIYYS